MSSRVQDRGSRSFCAEEPFVECACNIAGSEFMGFWGMLFLGWLRCSLKRAFNRVSTLKNILPAIRGRKETAHLWGCCFLMKQGKKDRRKLTGFNNLRSKMEGDWV